MNNLRVDTNKQLKRRKLQPANITKNIRKNIEKNTRDSTQPSTIKHTLRDIIDTILSNMTVQKVLNIDETMQLFNKYNKQCYKYVLLKLGGNPKHLKIYEILRLIMVKLPPNPTIESILDINYKLRYIENINDRECVVHYLDKKI